MAVLISMMSLSAFWITSGATPTEPQRMMEPSSAAGTILRQFPLAGSPVGLRDTLSFVVASPEPLPG